MTEDTPKRQSPCQWISRDTEGRPRCEHGWAMKRGDRWCCPEKRRQTRARYAATEKGKATKARWNQTPQARETKRRYDQSAARTSSAALRSLSRVR